MVHSNGSEEKHEPKKIHIDRKGEGVVTGADIECPSDVEVVNPEAYIATISDEDARLSMTMTIETNKGYVLPERQERRSQMGIGVIPMGAAFTPVRKVNYTVEATRMGSNTNLERLILEVFTNGTITPETAISEAAKILQQYFGMFAGFRAGVLGSDRGRDDPASPAGQRCAAPAHRRTGLFRPYLQLPEKSQHPDHQRTGAVYGNRPDADPQLRQEITDRSARKAGTAQPVPQGRRDREPGR